MVGGIMNMEFSNVNELKQRLMPALRNRRRELRRKNVNVTEEELWNYFVDHFWKKAINLSLAKMVDDILNQEVNFSNNDVI